MDLSIDWPIKKKEPHKDGTLEGLLSIGDNLMIAGVFDYVNKTNIRRDRHRRRSVWHDGCRSRGFSGKKGFVVGKKQSAWREVKNLGWRALQHHQCRGRSARSPSALRRGGEISLLAVLDFWCETNLRVFSVSWIAARRRGTQACVSKNTKSV